jgi:alkylhydroperoxidase family enzyme
MSTRPLVPPGGWLPDGAPRLPLPTPREAGWAFRAVGLLARWFGRQRVPAVFVLFARHRRLFWTWLPFAAQLMPFGRLPAPEREKLILRTAWLCRCRYEWGQHVEVARRAGVGDDEIVRVTQGPEAFPGARDQLLLRACDELVAGATLGDDTLAALREVLDARDVTELVILVGHYRMLAGLLNAAALPLDADMEAELQAFQERVGRS